MTLGEGYKPDLIGRRVRHNCEDPECTLRGVIRDIVPNPDKPLDGTLEWFVVVRFDEREGLPAGGSQAFPLSEVRVIEE